MFALWYLYYGYKELKAVADQQGNNASYTGPPTPVLYRKTPAPMPQPPQKPEVKPQPPSPPKPEVKPQPPTPPKPEIKPQPPSPPKPEVQPQPPSAPEVKPPPPPEPKSPAPTTPPKVQPPVDPSPPQPPPPSKPQPSKPVDVPRPRAPQAPEDRLMRQETKPEPPPWQPFPNPEDALLNPATYQRRNCFCEYNASTAANSTGGSGMGLLHTPFLLFLALFLFQ